MRQNRADSFGNAAPKKLGSKSVLNVVPHISLAHGGADAHGSRRIVNVYPAQFCHSLVDHTDLRAVTVGDGKLISGFHQIRQCPGSNFHRVPLLQCCITKRLVSQRDDSSFTVHMTSSVISAGSAPGRQPRINPGGTYSTFSFSIPKTSYFVYVFVAYGYDSITKE